ncbi:ribonuclease HII [Candidatus Peribacteria bacterium]|nr:ribonuclease HII [Candidatus Peribacteria bacterium]
MTTLIVGIDEAGRGALAGPVVACACSLPVMKNYPVKIGDSKQMTPWEREESCAWLIKNCVHGIGRVEADSIDRIGILAANEIAMQKAVKQVAKIHQNLYLLVDGRDKFWFDHPHSSIIRGDQSELCIGAASIIAKVTRDKRMMALAKKFPRFAFEKHKGYGTPDHFAAIKKHGGCSEHRKSFLKNLLS